MDNNVKIALVQFQSKLNCPDENMEKACGMIAQAASQGAKIVCFPELFSTGYNLDSLCTDVHLAYYQFVCIGVFLDRLNLSYYDFI